MDALIAALAVDRAVGDIRDTVEALKAVLPVADPDLKVIINKGLAKLAEAETLLAGGE